MNAQLGETARILNVSSGKEIEELLINKKYYSFF